MSKYHSHHSHRNHYHHVHPYHHGYHRYHRSTSSSPPTETTPPPPSPTYTTTTTTNNNNNSPRTVPAKSNCPSGKRAAPGSSFVCSTCEKSYVYRKFYELHLARCQPKEQPPSSLASSSALTENSLVFRSISDEYYNEDTSLREYIQANNRWTYNLDSLKRANFTIGHININSLVNKFEHIREILNATEIDLLLLNETKLEESMPSTAFMVPDYYLIRRDRNSRGGGIAIYIKKSLRLVAKYVHLDVELVHLKLQSCDQRRTFFHVLATYKPPYERGYTYIKLLQAYVHRIAASGEPLFIVGDLNMNWLDEKGKLLRHFCAKNKLKNHVREPTRVVDTVTSHYETLLDVVLHNRTLVRSTSVVNFPFSDHSFVLVECHMRSSRTESEMVEHRLSRRLVDKTMAGITDIINQIDFSILNDVKTVSQRLRKFNVVYGNIVNRKAPLRRIRHEELVDKHKTCMHLFKLYSESKSPRTVKITVQKMMQFVAHLTYKLCHM